MTDNDGSGPKLRRGTPRSGLMAHRTEMRRLLIRRGLTNPQLFGSAARGDDRVDSDIDILVDLPEGMSIIDLLAIQHELQDLVGVSVDLVPRDGIKERVRQRISKDLVAL